MAEVATVYAQRCASNFTHLSLITTSSQTGAESRQLVTCVSPWAATVLLPPSASLNAWQIAEWGVTEAKGRIGLAI